MTQEHHQYVVPIGTHLIIDIKEAYNLNNLAFIQSLLDKCVAACDAHIIHQHLHHFGANHGITGMYLLSESHISIHTWPEHKFAAIDIFLCGDHNPYYAVDVIKESFKNAKITVKEYFRH